MKDKPYATRMKSSIAFLILAAALCACCSRLPTFRQSQVSIPASRTIAISSPILRNVVDDAVDQTRHTVGYDPSYVKLDYPGGDVPIETGVCADVIVRAFRKGGVDLQKAVHEDISDNFSDYPRKWGLERPDSNIDHRRVANLMTYFKRKGCERAVTQNPTDYLPGDVVVWDLGRNQPHIGIVTNLRSESERNFLVAHNVGEGARLEDVLFSWPIIGHYRYFK